MPKFMPEGYHTLTPALTFKSATKAIEFYKKAFGAKEVLVIPAGNGKIMHAEMQIGDSRFMLGEENPAWPEHKSQETLGGSPSFSFNLYVPDADAAFQKAVAAGAKAQQPVEEAFWGDRYGRVVDPFGYVWGILTHVKDVTPAEMKKAAQEFMAHGTGKH